MPGVLLRPGNWTLPERRARLRAAGVATGALGATGATGATDAADVWGAGAGQVRRCVAALVRQARLAATATAGAARLPPPAAPPEQPLATRSSPALPGQSPGVVLSTCAASRLQVDHDARDQRLPAVERRRARFRCRPCPPGHGGHAAARRPGNPDRRGGCPRLSTSLADRRPLPTSTMLEPVVGLFGAHRAQVVRERLAGVALGCRAHRERTTGRGATADGVASRSSSTKIRLRWLRTLWPTGSDERHAHARRPRAPSSPRAGSTLIARTGLPASATKPLA